MHSFFSLNLKLSHKDESMKLIWSNAYKTQCVSYIHPSIRVYIVCFFLFAGNYSESWSQYRQTPAQTNELISASFLAIHWFQLLSLLALLHESLGMAHNRRRSEEPKEITRADIKHSSHIRNGNGVMKIKKLKLQRKYLQQHKEGSHYKGLNKVVQKSWCTFLQNMDEFKVLISLTSH